MTGSQNGTRRTASFGKAMPMLGVVAILLALTVSVITVFFLGNNVRSEIDALAAANSDTTQWSLAQTEVDLLALQVAAHAAAAGEVKSLREVRQRFDIFYSRVGTLTESRQFRALRSSAEVQDEVQAITGFLANRVADFDGSDEDLRAALPAIEEEMEYLRQAVRSFSLLGVKSFAAASDQRRETVASLLTRIGFITLALVLTLFLFVLLLLGLIRQSVQSERGAKDAKNRLQNVISTSIDGILAVGRDGRILDYNGAAERIFGHTREEAIGQDMAEVIIPDHLRKAHEAGMTRYIWTGEKRVVDKGLVRLEAKRKDGSVFPVEASISSIEADGEEIFISYMRDISKQVFAEQELVDARDKAVAGENAKAELLAVMSHEMRTPLNGLLGTMELLEDTNLAASQRKYLSAMETSARLLLHHINDVLNISSADAGQLNLVNSEIRPKELLDELIDSQRQAIEANGNRIDIVVSDEPKLMWADRIRLNQIILNLVGNANKFNRDGQIAVEFEGLPDGSAVEFRVTDTGIGIAEEDQETIFEDFRTLDPSYGRTAEGTGLGLGISKRLVEAMGGEIGVESEPGEGSLFWIRLPIGTPTSEANPHTMDEGEPVLEPAIGLKILLVEDNKINRLVAREMLEKAGHSVTEAFDGRDGIHFAGQMRYDLILMDISMPEVDGVTATETIRRENGPNQATPIVALTAHALPEDLERFRHAGVTDTLIKPLSRQALERVMGANMSSVTAPASSETFEVLAILSEQIGRAETVNLLDQFIEESDNLVHSLSSVDGTPEARGQLSELAHKSAGSASVFRSQAFADLLRKLETVLRDDESAELTAIAAKLETCWSTTRRDLMHCRDDMFRSDGNGNTTESRVQIGR